MTPAQRTALSLIIRHVKGIITAAEQYLAADQHETGTPASPAPPAPRSPDASRKPGAHLGGTG
jgi:hypothetical protein